MTKSNVAAQIDLEIEAEDLFSHLEYYTPRFWSLGWLVKQHSIHIRWPRGEGDKIAKYHHPDVSLFCKHCERVEAVVKEMQARDPTTAPKGSKRCHNRLTELGLLLTAPPILIMVGIVVAVIWKF